VYATAFSSAEGLPDNIAATLTMADGSIATIAYGSQGDKAAPRERIEMIGRGATCVIDDFKSLRFSRSGKSTSHKHRGGVDRGHKAEFDAFITSIVEGTPAPVSAEEIFNSMAATFALQESVQSGGVVSVQRVDGANLN
jgi:polar amino acid transport system substrate-binding protein